MTTYLINVTVEKSQSIAREKNLGLQAEGTTIEVALLKLAHNIQIAVKR